MTFSFPPLKDQTINDIIINDFEEVTDDKLLFIQSKLLLNNENILISLEDLKLIDIKNIKNNFYHMIFEITDENTYDFFYKLDKKILKFVKNESNKILKNKDTKLINNYFRSNLELPLNFNSKPLIKIRVPIERGNIKTKFFNIKNKPISISDLEIGSMINGLVKINSINFFDSYFFIDQSLYQGKLMTSNVAYNFLSETDSEPDILLSDQEN